MISKTVAPGDQRRDSDNTTMAVMRKPKTPSPATQRAGETMTLDNPGSNAADTGSSTASAPAKPQRKPYRRRTHKGLQNALVSPAEAYRDYLGLGANRSVPALHDHYAKHPPEKRAPSHDTLKRWAARYKWTEQSARHDQQLAETQCKAVMERLAADAADMASVFAGAAQVLLASALERRYELTPDQAASWAHKLAESAHMMAGGTTERTEHRVITADATDHIERWLTAAHEAEQAAQRGASPAADKPKVIDVEPQDIEPADAKPPNDQ